MFRKRLVSVMAVGSLTLSLPALVLAAAEPGATGAGAAKSTMHESSATPMTGVFTPRLQKVNSLIGTTLENTKNESLGKIEDLVLNNNRDRVAYAIVAYGGVMGIGQKYCAVPWHCLELKNEGKTCILNIDKDRFDQAPSFSYSKWPDMNNPQWAHEVHQFFTSGTGSPTRTMEHAQGERTREMGATAEREHLWGARHSRLIGTEVKGRHGEDLGVIEDIVIDIHKGDVAYGILSFGGVLGVGEKYSAVPWSALELRPAQRTARLDTDRKTLESIAFKPSDWPNLADPTYARNIYTRFDREPYWEVFGYVGGERGVNREAAWMPGSEFNKCFDAKTVETIEGTVESVGTFRPEPGAAEGLRLRLKTNKGNVLTVYAGPESYVHKTGLMFHNGDRLNITGSKTTVRERSVLMACEIHRGEQKVELRDRTGQPKWTTDDLRMR